MCIHLNHSGHHSNSEAVYCSLRTADQNAAYTSSQRIPAESNSEPEPEPEPEP